jgi:hypothetical protein
MKAMANGGAEGLINVEGHISAKGRRTKAAWSKTHVN